MMGKYLIPSKLIILFTFSFVLAYYISKINFEFKSHLNPIILFIIPFFLAALFWTIPEVNPDTTRYFRYAKYLEQFGLVQFIKDWGDSLWVHTDSIFPPLTYGIIFRIFGELRFNIQLLTSFMFAFTSVCTYYIGKHLFNERVGFYAALILATMPHLLCQVPLMLVDTFTIFFITLSVLLFIIAIKPSSSHHLIWIIFTALSIILTFLSKETSALVFIGVFPTLALIFSYSKTGFDKGVFLRGISTILLSVLFGLPMFILKHEVFMTQSMGSLGRRALSLAPKFSPYAVYPVSLLYQVGFVVILLAIFSFFTFVYKRNWVYVSLLAWTVIPFFVLMNTRIRYLMIIYPAIALMASITLDKINNREIRRYFLASIIICSTVISLFVYLPYLQNYSDRHLVDAAEYTNRFYPNTNIAIFTIYDDSPHPGRERTLAPIFDYYSLNQIQWYNHEKFSSFQKSPEIIVVISDKIYPDTTPQNLTVALYRDYDLVRVYSSGSRGIWAPAITSVYVSNTIS
jgi:4-amino-4-deoxy-L-arabinose transferase-like glycosyltransferase